MNKIVSGSETGAKTGAASDLAAVLAASGRQGKRRWRGRLLILLILIAAAAVAAYFYMGRGQSELSYDTQPAKRGDLTVLVTATGSVQPTEQVDISSELSGTVRDVNVDYNSTVKSGEVLALLDTNKLEADLKSSRAKLNSAKANVVKANADMQSAGTSLERLKSLVRSNVSTQQSLDDASYKYDSAVAAKQINEAEVLASRPTCSLPKSTSPRRRSYLRSTASSSHAPSIPAPRSQPRFLRRSFSPSPAI